MAAAPKDDPKSLSLEAPLSFEGHLGALEKVVADLEGDALSLEASIERYRVGVDHLSACRRILDGAEKRLAELVLRADGSGAEQRPLAVGADGLVDAGPVADATKKSAPRALKKPTPPPSGGTSDGDIPF